MKRCFPPSDANLVWLDETDSTNSLASRLVESWLAGGHGRLGDTIILASWQRVGRGRGDHRWQSPPGGAYVTWLGWVRREELVWLPLAAGVSVSESVETLHRPATIALEWPNDLLLAGKKVGGILCQARGSGDEAWVAVGFGVNVASSPTLPPGDAASVASLREVGFSGDVAEFSRQLAVVFAVRFRALVGHPEETRARWMSRTVHEIGQTIRVRSGGRIVEGRFGGLGADGSLVIEAGSQLVAVLSGEIIAAL